MQPRKYVVIPQMEGKLKNIRKIAGNLWFSWNVDAVELFDYLDEQLWKETNHNPLQTLIRLSSQRLNEIRKDEGFLAHAERVYRHFKSYMNPAATYEYHLESPIDFTTAYFSLEFGITESLPLYSGGLGILAGDHLKSASDLYVPVVGVAFFIRKAIFDRDSRSTAGNRSTIPELKPTLCRWNGSGMLPGGPSW